MSTDWREDRLPCGGELGAIIDQVARGLQRRRDLHQRSCPFCQAALEEAVAAWEPVRSLAAEEVVPPQGLVESILRRLEGMAQVGRLTLAGAGGGVTTVTVRALAALAEAVVDGMAGVARVGSSFGRVMEALRDVGPKQDDGQDEGGGPPPVPGPEVGIDLRLTTEYGVPIPDLAEEVRRLVRREVAAGTGLDVAEVNVEVIDVDSAERLT